MRRVIFFIVLDKLFMHQIVIASINNTWYNLLHDWLLFENWVNKQLNNEKAQPDERHLNR